MSSRKRTPDQDSPETPTAVAEPPAAETQPDNPSFAERVGQRKRVPDPDPFGIATDTVAGVRLFESKQDQQMAIMFGDGRPEDKPSQAVIDRMKEAGFKWKSVDRIWAHPFTPESARRTHIEAERLYQEVRQMIRQEKGIEAGQDVPF
ncbi:MAG TPA: hypothetical protein VNX28_10050 [Gemmataceae bacterium]|jgi:hypothetical protein|nr:hypothetical protein [Gemmataceae bacterium]